MNNYQGKRSPGFLHRAGDGENTRRLPNQCQWINLMHFIICLFWSNCMLHIQTMEHYTAMRMNKLKPHTVIWISHKYTVEWKKPDTK